MGSSKFPTIIFMDDTNYIGLIGMDKSPPLNELRFADELKTLFTSSVFSRQETDISAGNINTSFLKIIHNNNESINS